jgi:outer membrane protein OmpA-like peptidoglycan-associated protein
MRHPVALAVILAMSATTVPIQPLSAQSNPTAGQIVKSLTPSGNIAGTRGIHVGPVGVQQAEALSVSLTVQFATGSAALTPQAIQVLNDLGTALSSRSLAPYRFRIEGHTDTVGSRDSNKALSNQRAARVVDYLVGNFHLDRGRLQPIGMGEDDLLIPTPDQTPEPRNRRVVVVNAGT